MFSREVHRLAQQDLQLHGHVRVVVSQATMVQVAHNLQLDRLLVRDQAIIKHRREAVDLPIIQGALQDRVELRDHRQVRTIVRR